MMIVYGIKNCDTVKKALMWLKANGIAFEFHDYKKEGITKEKLRLWVDAVGWEVLLNKKGTTWRKLDDKAQASLKDPNSAIEIMLNNTSIIKRPIIELRGNKLIVGYDEDTYKKSFN
jgi:arsenate reductase (glutaredoxin)